MTMRAMIFKEILDMKAFKTTLLIAIFSLSFTAQGQEVLNRDGALQLTLEHNYNIQVARKDVEVAENNKSLNNSGYLPTVSGTANGTVTYNEGENETVNGDFAFEATDAYNYSASAGLNYTIFNGFGRMYNYRSLKEQYKLTELQARQIIENTVLELSNAYFQVAQLRESKNILSQALKVSSERLKRAKLNYDYGQSTQIDVLNAEVDVNNDSINLLNAAQQLANAKRNLNLIMGRDINTPFAVDTNVNFSLSQSEEQLLENALDRNVQIEQTMSQLRNSEFAMRASRAGWFPSLSANAGYAYSGSQNPNGAFLTGNSSYGPQAGLTLSWNLFDGGSTRVQNQNAKINFETQEIVEEQTRSTVKRDLLNAYATYTNALFVMNAEQANLATNRRNFLRSEELYGQGQITSIEFRQAQINMRNAQNNASIAKYNAKNAELQLKQLAGILLKD